MARRYMKNGDPGSTLQATVLVHEVYLRLVDVTQVEWRQRAERAMHVAQPSLSQTVRSLEAELGVELFHRTPRNVVLTAAGEAIVGPARQALRDAATARAA